MGDFIYLYGLIPTSEAEQLTMPSLQGFDGKGTLHSIRVNNITAIVCQLDSEQYSEERIQYLLQNDMEWLHNKAIHHHDTLMKISQIFTIIPLKFCVIFKDQASLEEAILSNEQNVEKTFISLDGNEEWNVKIYCDDYLLKKQVSQSHPVVKEKRLEIKQLPRGRQYFEEKKLDKLIEAELENEKNRIGEKIHQQLKELVIQGDIKNSWNKTVTGRKENMIWNGVYLASETDVEPFLEKIQQFDTEMRTLGWRFEASGPWPAYHFSSFHIREEEMA